MKTKTLKLWPSAFSRVVIGTANAYVVLITAIAVTILYLAFFADMLARFGTGRISADHMYVAGILIAVIICLGLLFNNYSATLITVVWITGLSPAGAILNHSMNVGYTQAQLVIGAAAAFVGLVVIGIFTSRRWAKRRMLANPAIKYVQAAYAAAYPDRKPLKRSKILSMETHEIVELVANRAGQ